MAAGQSGGQQGIQGQQLPPRRGWQYPWVKLAQIAAVIIGLLLVLVLANWAWNNSKKAPPDIIPSHDKGVQFVPVKPTTIAAQKEPPPSPTFDFAANIPKPGKQVAATSPARNSTLFAYAAHTAAAEETEAPKTHPVPSDHDEQEASTDDALTASLRPVKTGKTVKGHVLKNARLIIPQGTHIACELKDRIITQLTGFVRCETREAVRGKHGDVILLPERTLFFGQYSQGVVQGNDRIGILWTRGTTPDDIELDVNSPAVDELGSAGVTGYIDNHIGSKLGALVLYTLIEAGPSIANTALQNNNRGGNTYNTTTIAGPSQNVLGGFLQKKLDQPPTLVKNQSEAVDIIVAQNWDLSCCIKLELR
jgi:type IV secretion system protein VirB10